MTIDQLNKLTDEEVNRKVAERMGVKPLSYGWLAYNPETTGIAYQGDFKADVENWLDAGFRRRKDYIVKEDVRYEDYTKDLNAAFTLVEKLRGERWTPEMFRPGLHWIVTFRRITMGEDMKIDENLSHSAADPSLARAISLAFLAVTEERETE